MRLIHKLNNTLAQARNREGITE